MPESGSQPKLLCISGSLRSESFNTAVLETIVDKLDGRATCERFDIGTVPHYNADLDTDPALPEVKALKDAIAAADGVVIVTPEYNYSIPGVLKNALDWASRPGYQSVLKDKPVFIATVSGGGTGGVRCQAHLKNVLAAVLAQTFVCPEVAVPTAGQKIENGRLTDETSIKLVMTAVDSFLQTL
ncbi:NADPH-dependent FMN reductase [Microbaculum marinum]|uniref:NADPH-dependent FMN reductase n=1 Tax=Microbaculum marinum TaxID=1764581 RepID=A0AAW9RIH7_9HYPH